ERFADRRLGQQAVGAARGPVRARKGGRLLRREICDRRRAAPALLERLSHRAAEHRVLARSAIPAARPYPVSSCGPRWTVGQDAALPLTPFGPHAFVDTETVSTCREHAVRSNMPTTHINEPRRTLLLTGASRGIGHATVKRFSSAGWRVITCSRHAFPEQCPWEAGPEDHIQVDLADPDDTLNAIAEIKRRLENGHLHALVNNAAISPKAEGGQRLSTINTAVEVWDHVFRVNFFAPIMLARGLMDELKTTRGSVVNVTSIAGSRVHPFAGAAYSTSKAALAALTRELAADFGPLGIWSTAIAPGEIDTAILS